MELNPNSNTRTVKNNFIVENAVRGVKIYFDEKHHKYTDEFGNPYTSVTTMKEKYAHTFETKKMAKICAAIGKNPNHPKYLKYKGKTAWQLEQDWNTTKETACEKGTIKHNYLEDAVKLSNGYRKFGAEFINDRIYTINEVIENHSYGRVNLTYFDSTGIKEKYPRIYKTIEIFTLKGFYIYSELCVYDYERLISGLIDLILINFDTNEFVLLDWKTNAADIRFDSGYFEKNTKGELTTNFINTDLYFKTPLSHLVYSTGNSYAMQLSAYTYLTELRGLNCIGIILYHIQDAEYEGGLERVTPVAMPYLKPEVELMFNHHFETNKKFNSYQTQLSII